MPVGVASCRAGSGGTPVGSPVFKTGGATLDVTRWVRLPCAPATPASCRPREGDHSRSDEPNG
jgi:hypothetical protein